MNTYSISDSRTGDTIINSIELDAEQVEILSSDTPDGHFRAGDIAELVDAGIDANRIVFAS